MKQTLLTEIIELLYRKVFRQFLFYVENRIFYVKPDDFARGQFDEREMREHGEALKYKFMLVVFNNCRCLSEKIRRRTDRYPVVMQLVRVI